MVIIFKKMLSLKMHCSKFMTSFTYCDGIKGPTAYLPSMVASPYAKEANEMLSSTKFSSTRSTSQCKGQQATFSLKVIFLHFSYTPALHVLRDAA